MPYASLSVGGEEQYVDTLLGNPDSLALRFVGAIAAGAQGGIDLPDPLATIPTGRKCYAWSKEEDAAHEIFETHASQLAQRLNLVLGQDYEFSIDAIGNSFFTVFGTDEYKARKSQTEKKGAKTKKGTKSDFITPSIIIGSHLDSTPNGGIYDGVLGVGAGLEAVEKILSAGKKPKKNITIVAWRGEESSPNNGVGCFGSQIATGQLSMDQLKKVEYQKGINFLQHLADHNGLSIEAMEAKIAAMIKTPYVNMKRFPDTLELHIEQSAILENRGQDLGIVTGGIGGSRREVWSDTLTRVETLDTYGYKKVRISAHGFRGHTGGTPPNPALISTNLEGEDIMYRKDALVGLGNLLSMLYTSDDQSNNALERIKVSHVGFAEPLQFTSIPDSAYCDILVPEGDYTGFIAEVGECEGILESEMGITIDLKESNVEEGGYEQVIAWQVAKDKLAIPVELYREATEQLGKERSQSDVGLSRITVVDFEIDPSKDSLTFNLDYRHIGGENTFNALIQSVQCVIFETLNTGSVKLKSHSLSQEVNADIVDILRGIAREKGYKFIEMPSSPSHDAAMLGKVRIRIGMIFVPHNGVSHNPREHLEANNFPKPMEVFADGIEALANR